MALEDMELRAVYAQTLMELATDDDRIMVVEADLMRASGTLVFKDRFPWRAVDLGVAEQNMIAFAAGLAAEGKIPFAATFTPFATRRGLDQFVVSAAYPGLHVVLVGTSPGITAELNGGTHMCFADLSRMRVLPKVAVFCPCDAYDLRASVKACVEYQGPVYLQMIRGKMPRVFDEGRTVAPGQVDVLREGTDVTVIASGFTTHVALESAKLLDSMGISAHVMNITGVRPTDVKAIVDGASRTGFVVTVENGSVMGGLGGMVAEIVSDSCPMPVKRLGVQDKWGEVGKLDYLTRVHRLTPELLADDVRSLIGRGE